MRAFCCQTTHDIPLTVAGSIFHVCCSISYRRIIRQIVQISPDQCSHSLHVGPLLWIVIPPFFHSHSNEWRTASWWNHGSLLMFHDTQIKLATGIVIKHRFQRHDFPQQDGKGKDIALSIVWIAFRHFGCHEWYRASSGSKVETVHLLAFLVACLQRRCQRLAQPEIKNFQIIPYIEAKIFLLVRVSAIDHHQGWPERDTIEGNGPETRA